MTAHTSYTAAEVVTIVTVMLGGIVTIIGAVFAGLAALRATQTKAATHEIKAAVQTMNGLALGQLADAAETRRIEDKPAATRTAAEAAHMHDVPPP